MEDLLYKLALRCTPKVGPVITRHLVTACGGVRAIFEERPKILARIPGITEPTASFIASGKALIAAEKELPLLERHGIEVLFYLDKNYPDRLKVYDTSPALLYFKGNTNLNHLKTISVVGTRKPSPLGLANTERMVEELAPFSPLIISGLAYGVDIAAHRAALKGGLETIAVLGHGLHQIYPAVHKNTAMAMLEQGGLLSEYPFFAKPDREHFPMRNRIVAALSDAVLVVESPQKGGSIITAKFANEYHREVFALPGRSTDPVSAGCNWLIKNHRASLVESGTDIAKQLNWSAQGLGPRQQLRLFENLSEEEKIIVDLLRNQEDVHIDKLLHKSLLTSGLVAASLLELECRGLIRVLPGKRYVLVK